MLHDGPVASVLTATKRLGQSVPFEGGAIRGYDPGFPIFGLKFSRASNRRRRRWLACKRPTPTNGGR
jgi:hypothetical protein